MIQIVKGYRENASLRLSFNELARTTFGLNFEGWYQNGLWTDRYNPYSVVLDGRVVANVSLNRTDMLIAGTRRTLYQLGTVMTAAEYRNRGYIRAIMAEIERDTTGADGVYLFGSDSVLSFYPKFGFQKGTEHIYAKTVQQDGVCRMRNIPMNSAEGWNQLRAAMAQNAFRTACEMVDNPELILFYVTQFMQDCIFYDSVTDTWVIAELEGGELLIHNVFSTRNITLDDVIAAFGSSVKQVVLGFAPQDAAGFTCSDYHEDDCTFFVKGSVFQHFGSMKLRIPSLSHA